MEELGGKPSEDRLVRYEISTRVPVPFLHSNKVRKFFTEAFENKAPMYPTCEPTWQAVVDGLEIDDQDFNAVINMNIERIKQISTGVTTTLDLRNETFSFLLAIIKRITYVDGIRTFLQLTDPTGSILAYFDETLHDDFNGNLNIGDTIVLRNFKATVAQEEVWIVQLDRNTLFMISTRNRTTALNRITRFNRSIFSTEDFSWTQRNDDIFVIRIGKSWAASANQLKDDTDEEDEEPIKHTY